MALSGKVVHLVRLDLPEQTSEVGTVAQVAVMQEQLVFGEMGIAVNVIQTGGVERGCATDDAVDLVCLPKQEFCEMGSILAGNASEEGFLLILSLLTPNRRS